jgi:hypothetical protein
MTDMHPSRLRILEIIELRIADPAENCIMRRNP